MPERQLALTGRPEIIFSGRGYKAADMNGVILERTITLKGLIERWAGKRVSDYTLDFDGIKELTRQINPIPVYLLINQLGFAGGHRKCRSSKLSYQQMMSYLTERRGFYEVLFNLDDIEKFERENFPPVCTSFSQLYGVEKAQTDTTLDKEQVKNNQGKTDGLNNDVTPTSAALQADIKIQNSKTLGALYSFILALVHEKGIDLAKSELQKNLVLTAKDLCLPLSKGFVSETIKELADYENAHKG